MRNKYNSDSNSKFSFMRLLRGGILLWALCTLGYIAHRYMSVAGNQPVVQPQYGPETYIDAEGDDKINSGDNSGDNNIIIEDEVSSLRTFETMLENRADENNNIALLILNSGYEEVARNWLQWVKIIDFNNFLFVCEDKSVCEQFDESYAFSFDSAIDMKGDAHYGSIAFQETMMFRIQAVLEALNNGFSVLNADLDAVWMDNPFRYLDENALIQGQQHKGSKMSGGLIYLKNSPRTIEFWTKNVIECQENNIKVLSENADNLENIDTSIYTEQYCINEGAKKEGMPKYLLKDYYFPDGKAYFENQLPQKSGTYPAVIHNNWLVGKDNKIERFKEWKLWKPFSDSRKEDFFVPPSVSKRSEGRFIIHVITFNRPKSLQRLLHSLESIEFDNAKIDLRISVDKETDESDSSRRQLVVNVAESYNWPHGKLTLMLREKNLGLTGQWLRSQDDTSENDIVLVIEDDIEVSESAYTWIKNALNAYYFTEDYDPQLFGIGLSRQHTILQNSVYFNSNGKTTYDILEDSNLNYSEGPFFYQLLSTWGTIIFPHHWKNFVAWHDEVTTANPDFIPCVPNLRLNKWFIDRPGNIWSLWFVRYAWEQGLYGINPKLEGKRALTINHREAGINFKKPKGTSNTLAGELSEAEMATPRSMPIFDLSFRPIHYNQRRILPLRSKLFRNRSEKEKCKCVSQKKGLVDESYEPYLKSSGIPDEY